MDSESEVALDFASGPHVEIRTAAGWERWDWPCATYAEALACARDVSRVWGFACRVVRA